jgi:hypothetical protein
MTLAANSESMSRERPEAAAPADRLERNQQLFRMVNDRLFEISIHEFDAPWTGKTTYLCECADPACLDTIELTLDEYENLRAESDLRAVTPGHEQPGCKVILRTQRFSVVSGPRVSDQLLSISLERG